MNNSYIEKLYNVIDLMKENHPCINIKYSKLETQKIIDNYLTKYKLDDEYSFFYITNSIIKKLLEPYDSHTNLKPLDNINNLWFPFSCIMINNYPYIKFTSKEFRKYRNYKIKKINDVDIEMILKEMSEYILSNNESWLNWMIEIYLSSLFYLKCLPSLRKMGNIIILSLEKNNKIIELELDINKVKDQHLEIDTNVKNYSYEFLKNDTIMIHFTRCIDKDNKMSNLIKILKENENNINWYILDLRNNSGGNSDIFMPLFDFLKNKKTITLVNYRVFSGGIWAAQYMSDIGSIIIGEEVGDTINNFADKHFFDIDNNFRLDISCKFFYFDNHKFNMVVGKNEFNRFYKNENNKKWLSPCNLKIDYKIDKDLNNYIDLINQIIDN